jgi:iron complex outermembrane receptor protein
VVRSRIGDPKVLQGTGYVNAALPIGDTNWTAFAFGGYQFRDSTSSAFAREPGNVNNVLSIYPNGFLPQIKVLSKDLTVTAGVRGQMGDWNATIKLYGRNRLDYRTQGSLNSTYGAASQTSFYDGAMIYDQGGRHGSGQAVQAGRDRPERGMGRGSAPRRLSHHRGRADSYNRGPVNSPGGAVLTSGAQGFIGFQAGNALKTSRISNAIYLDLEAKLPSIFTFGAAVRGEHYSDFGDIATGKLSARADLPTGSRCAARCRPASARRRCSSSITSTASVLTTLPGQTVPTIVETGTFLDQRIARSLGGQALRPEKSTNFSAGRCSARAALT